MGQYIAITKISVRENVSKEKITIPYVRIVEKRDKVVLIDFGEDNPAWLPLYCTTLSETDYTVFVQPRKKDFCMNSSYAMICWSSVRRFYHD